MTPDQIASVQATLAAIESDLSRIAGDFYTELFVRHPEMRPLFTNDIDGQREKFAAEMLQIGMSLDQLDDLRARTADLGRRHRGYGVRSAHYGQVRDVLLDVLARSFGDDFTDDDRLAWRRMYNLVAQAMQTPSP